MSAALGSAPRLWDRRSGVRAGWERVFFGVKVCIFGVGARVSQSLSVGVSQGGREIVKMPGIIFRAWDKPDMRFPFKPPTVS